MPEHRDRSFAAKAACFNAGYERLKSRAFDVIGNLDADITFEPEYCAFLLSKFAGMPRLGVTGTPYVEDAGKPDSHSYDHDVADLEHVSGACQMFRRQCFDEVGGYTPIKGGRHRLGRGHDRANERMADADLRRDVLPASSEDGHGRSGTSDGPLSAR